jgi:hypothetical protein
MVDKAISDGVDDYTVFNEPFSGPVPEHSAELELPGQGDAQVRFLLATRPGGNPWAPRCLFRVGFCRPELTSRPPTVARSLRGTP